MNDAFTLAWRYATGLVHPEDLPMAAAELLAAGVGAQSAALCDLAGRRGRGERSAELSGLLWQAMAELGLPVPDEDFVGRCLLHRTAARLVSEEITSGDAVSELWRASGGAADAAEQRFAALADQVCCPDCLGDRESGARQDWERELRAAAVEVASAADHGFTVSWYRD
ncbi:hypothetical protein ACFVUY_04405 [Kitasatospora sp. NPDC058063]|uniref:hypothetical protein n=1 Tax=unclassified Kitasatospora TaxID=2633591 RepID=UPI0036DA9BD5